jgi:hypothetical protein
MKSMQSVINYLMLFPIVASIMVGWLINLNDTVFS